MATSQTAHGPHKPPESKPALHDGSSERLPISDMQDGYEITNARNPIRKVGYLCSAKTDDAMIELRWALSCGDRPPIGLQPEQLRELVFIGMPMRYRLGLWKEWTKGKLLPAGEMEQLQHLASEKSVKQIALDVERTKITWLDVSQSSSLQHVLTAYAGWNPSVGYCQGMNFMTAVFVSLGFEERECFDGLRFLMEEICPGYHASDLGGYRRDSLVLEQLVQFFLPTMYANLHKAHVSVQVMATNHLISLTSRDWPLAATVRLWDVILMDGVTALFGSFVALLELYMPSSPFGHDDAGEDTLTRSNGTAFNLMISFKQGCLSGVRNDFETVMALTRYYTELIPDSLLAHLRKNADEHVSSTCVLNNVCSVYELPNCLLANLPECADEDHHSEPADEIASRNFASTMLDSVLSMYDFPDALLVHPTKSADESSSDDDFATMLFDSMFGVHDPPDDALSHPSEGEDGNSFVNDFAVSVLDTVFGPHEELPYVSQDHPSKSAGEDTSEGDGYATNMLDSMFSLYGSASEWL